MSQFPRCIITPTPFALDLMLSGNNWLNEFIFSNSKNVNLKTNNHITFMHPQKENETFVGRLIYSGIKQSTDVSVLLEDIPLGNVKSKIYAFENMLMPDVPTEKVNIGFALFQRTDFDEDPNNPFYGNYALLTVCQNADLLLNTQLNFTPCITVDNPIEFFKELNNSHVDVVGLLESLVSTTKVFANTEDKYSLIAKKLIGDLHGLNTHQFKPVINVVEGEINGQATWEKATMGLSFLGSQIKVTFKQDAESNTHSIETKLKKDGSTYLAALKLDKLVEQHLNVSALHDVFLKAYSDQSPAY